MSFRFLHTADWHLGQLFHGFDRDYEHARFLAWLLSTLREHTPDALVLAGDVFDTVNPSALAQRRFYQFLAQVRAALPQLQILITAGNHDAAARLEAPSDLLETLQITVIGTVPRSADGRILLDRLIVPLKNADGQVAALALAVPFLRPTDVPPAPEATDPYLGGIQSLYHQLTQRALALRAAHHPAAALIALGHCHLASGVESRDSERRLIIGGSESLQPEVFPPELAYVALGHLHKPQEIDGGRIRYSGSPIPLSFSEQDYGHRVLLVTVAADAPVSVTTLPIPKTTSLQRLPARGSAPTATLLDLIAALPPAPDLPLEQQPFLEIHVLDDGPDPTRRHRLETALAGKPVRLASIKLIPPPRPELDPAVAVSASTASLADLSTLDPEQLLGAAHQERYQSAPAPAVLLALREILAADATAPRA